MDPPLIDRIYECSLVPELWPDVLHEVGQIAEAGASLFMTNADVISWTASKIAHEATAQFVKEGWSGADRLLLVCLPRAMLDF
jgi:hypothetical protein